MTQHTQQGKNKGGNSNPDTAFLDSLYLTAGNSMNLDWLGDARSSSAQASATRSKAHGDLYLEALCYAETPEERAAIRHEYEQLQTRERECQKSNDDEDFVITLIGYAIAIGFLAMTGSTISNKWFK